MRAPLHCPHTPTHKQLLFLGLNTEEAFYGGAAGGGKSDAILMAALQYVDVPGYAALILRCTYKSLTLPGALLDRAKQWLMGKAKWSAETSSFIFQTSDPANPARLVFGYLEHDRDVEQYQSAEFQFVGFDELTQFSNYRYRYMHSRTRRLEGSNIPIRIRGASNPGSIGHEWVKQRFIIEGKEYNRPFIPAKLDDNPHLDRATYVKSLNNLDPITRERLLNGDWDVRKAGGMFKREWFEIVDAVPALRTVVRCWDMAASEQKKKSDDPDFTVGLKMSVADGIYYVEDVRRVRATSFATDKLIKQTAALDGQHVTIREEQEPGSAGKSVINSRRTMLAGYMYKGVLATGSKAVRAGPFATQAEAGNVKLLKGTWINEFLDELELFTGEDGGGHDDQVDGASGAFDELTAPGRSFMVG